MNYKTTVTMDCWAYGESAEAGNEPRLRKGEEVEEVGPPSAGRNGATTYARTKDGRIERVLLAALSK